MCKFDMCDENIQEVAKFKYLGHVVTNDLTDQKTVRAGKLNPTQIPYVQLGRQDVMISLTVRYYIQHSYGGTTGRPP